MKQDSLSKSEAQHIVLRSQLLDGKNHSTSKIIKSLGYIQIDTISVIERAHHHILWTRNSNYSTDELNKLLRKKKVFEYWSHAASYLPIEDYRFSLPRKHLYQTEKSHWFKVDKKTKKYVLDRIKAEGPLASKDFKTEKKTSGWYDWKPTKKALEQLFMEGRVMTKERRGFQKLYDLPENVLPSSISTKKPSDQEFAQHLIQKQLKAFGIATIDEIAYLRGGPIKKLVKEKMQELIEDKKVSPITVDGVDQKYFALNSELRKKPSQHENKVYFLSPFDNLIIQRKRLKHLFDFDYQLECYVPQPKRKFGYFCLPIFHQNQFHGLLDLKAHRKEEQLEVLSLHYQKKKLRSKLIKDELQKFASFNQCKKVIR